MRWYFRVLIGMSLVLCASASYGERWELRVHHGGGVDQYYVSDIDSLIFRDATPAGMVWIPSGKVRLGQIGIAEPVNDFYVDGFYIDRYEVTNAKYKASMPGGTRPKRTGTRPGGPGG